MKIRAAKKKLKAIYKEIAEFKLIQEKHSALEQHIHINRLCWKSSDIRDSVSNKDLPRIEDYESRLRNSL